MACPREGCGGEIVVKKSKRGKIFYGCGNYPKCDVVFWDKPVQTACPQCQKPFVLEKYNAKKDETTQYCSEETCDYRTGGGATKAAATAEKETGTQSQGFDQSGCQITALFNSFTKARRDQ